MAKPPDFNSLNNNESYSSPKFSNEIKKIETNSPKKKKRQSAIPKPIANRMARRIALTTGLPTFSGMGIFVGSYLIVSKGIAEIPPGITLLSSAACFLTGLLGLSYGILSASWDESPGSFLGFENIRPNIGRVRSAFKENKQVEKQQ